MYVILNLQTGDRKPNNFIVTEAGKSVLFKEWELIVDEEDEVGINIHKTSKLNLIKNINVRQSQVQ